jgi:indolepyruvate ferredoxin oxidoreductase alpha subunit
MNVMVDPLMALNLTPVHGGLVILLGDDPGGYGSQNDQDTRPIANLLEMPLLEPSGPAEGFALIQEAFTASERLHTPVIVRITRSFTQCEESIEVAEGPYDRPHLGLAREPWRFVPVPRNVVGKHRELHARLETMRHWTERLRFNTMIGSGEKGILAAGFAYRKLLDVLGNAPREDVSVIQLTAVYPLPEGFLATALVGCRELLVLEENEPYLEVQLKALAHERGLAVRILGKRTGHVPREGELFRWQIQRALSLFLSDFRSLQDRREEDEALERPRRENYCAGCRYGPILDMLRSAATELGEELMLVGDPGCLATVADRLDAKYAIGSAVGVADGLAKAGFTGRAVAIFGDSSFFHTSLPAICNAAVNGSDILMIVLDNGATVTSGFQPNPGVGRDALGRPAPRLDMEAIARACGVGFVHSTGPDGLDAALPRLFREALCQHRLGLLIIQTTCEGPVAGG